MPATSSSRTGVCIVRVSTRAEGSVLIEVSTVRDVELAPREKRRPFTESQVAEAVQAVSKFIEDCLQQHRSEGSTSHAP